MSTRGLNKFWKMWIDRFMSSTETFITPNDPLVQNEIRESEISDSDGRKEMATKMWVRVVNSIEYRLSKEWKTPRETLTERVADCEDFTFLLASMFSGAGIDEHVIGVGELIFPDGSSELHTWNVVDGMIVDGTGLPKDIEGMKYKSVETFVIENGVERK